MKNIKPQPTKNLVFLIADYEMQPLKSRLEQTFNGCTVYHVFNSRDIIRIHNSQEFNAIISRWKLTPDGQDIAEELRKKNYNGLFYLYNQTQKETNTKKNKHIDKICRDIPSEIIEFLWKDLGYATEY